MRLCRSFKTKFKTSGVVVKQANGRIEVVRTMYASGVMIGTNPSTCLVALLPKLYCKIIINRSARAWIRDRVLALEHAPQKLIGAGPAPAPSRKPESTYTNECVDYLQLPGNADPIARCVHYLSESRVCPVKFHSLLVHTLEGVPQAPHVLF